MDSQPFANVHPMLIRRWPNVIQYIIMLDYCWANVGRQPVLFTGALLPRHLKLYGNALPHYTKADTSQANPILFGQHHTNDTINNQCGRRAPTRIPLGRGRTAGSHKQSPQYQQLLHNESPLKQHNDMIHQVIPKLYAYILYRQHI